MTVDGGDNLIGFWYVFFCTDYTVLDKLFELCPFMQRVIPPDKTLLCSLGLL